METDEKIAQILSKCCPAFYRDNKIGGVVWHHCHCKAQHSQLSNHLPPCDCVWHLTSLCNAGKWPQLAFLDEARQQANKEVQGWLVTAKAAIAKAD